MPDNLKSAHYCGFQVFIFCLLLVGPYATALEKSFDSITFSIKPRLCVLTTHEAACRDTLIAKWTAATTRSLCLYQSGKHQPLHCWNNAKIGQYQFEFIASVSTNFYLREHNAHHPLIGENFLVVYNDKKHRRQRRNPWSFF